MGKFEFEDEWVKILGMLKFHQKFSKKYKIKFKVIICFNTWFLLIFGKIEEI